MSTPTVTPHPTDPARDADLSRSDQSSSGTRTHLRGVIRKRWIPIWIGTCSLTLVIGLLAGALVTSSLDVARENANMPLHATARIEQREFRSELTVASGQVNKGEQITVDEIALTSGATPVITQVNAKVGDEISSGSVIVHAAGTPIIALHLPFSLYRDLEIGDRGDDVQALQESLHELGALQSAVTGKLDQATWDAWEKVLAKAGAGTENSESIQHSTVVAVPSKSVQIIGAPQIGETLSGGEAVLVLRSNEAKIVGRLDSLEKESFTEGMSISLVAVTNTNVELTAKLTHLGEFTEGDAEAGTTPGYAFEILTADGELDELQHGAQIEIRPAQDSEVSISKMSVPLIAVHSDTDGEYMHTVAKASDSADPSKFKRINVKTGQQQDGWVAIEGDAVNEGDFVVLGDSW